MNFGLSAPGARTLVLDANILIRAVLGRRVLSLIERYAGRVRFVVPEEAVADARAYVPRILIKKGLSREASASFLETLERLPLLVTVMPRETYADLEAEARRRLEGRDEEDWPWPWPSSWAARSGRRTRTSSAVEWQPGPRIGWSSS